jgi:hypothetical protein
MAIVVNQVGTQVKSGGLGAIDAREFAARCAKVMKIFWSLVFYK